MSNNDVLNALQLGRIIFVLCSCSSTAVSEILFALFDVEIAPPDPEDVLSREKCEDALRAVRQARWFEVILYHVNYRAVPSNLNNASTRLQIGVE